MNNPAPNIQKLHQDAPLINLAPFGFRLVVQYSDHLSKPVPMKIETVGQPLWDNYNDVLQGLLGITQSRQWLVGDLMVLGRDLFPDRHAQAAPVAGKATNTLRNWESVAWNYPNLYLPESKSKIIDDVLMRGEMLVSGEHIGRYRHPDLDWTFHQHVQSLNKDSDQLNLRGLTLMQALADKMSLSEMKAFHQHRVEKSAQASQSVQTYLQQRQQWALDNTYFSKAVTTFEVSIAQGASYTDILKDLRTLAKDIQAQAQHTDVKIKGKVVK